MAQIKVKFTKTRKNEPLVELDGGLFTLAECTPKRLRRLAVLFLQIAADAERQSAQMPSKYWSPNSVVVDDSNEAPIHEPPGRRCLGRAEA